MSAMRRCPLYREKKIKKCGTLFEIILCMLFFTFEEGKMKISVLSVSFYTVRLKRFFCIEILIGTYKKCPL